MASRVNTDPASLVVVKVIQRAHLFVDGARGANCQQTWLQGQTANNVIRAHVHGT